MVKTRGQIKASRKKYYLRSKSSACRGKGPAVCRSLKGCKYASKGKKRSFCRKTRNVTKRSAPGSRRRRRRSSRR